MSYVALYRKARPQTFEEVKGQDHIVKTLKNQVRAGRTQHAYLFCGTRGTGKTSVAKIMAKAVNCEHPVDGSPCNECASCRAIAAGNSMNVIEIDAASNNGVDNIREIVEEVRYRPTQGNFKVYIIDEVHMLSAGAFNALLKTLEEPPSYVIFILATTEAGKIPTTILSRCQRYDFRRIDQETIIARMRELTDRENVEAEDRALRFVARSADGSMRDALSLLDQCMAFYMGEALTYEKALNALGAVDTDVFGELLGEIIAGNAGRAVLIFEKIIERGREVGQFVSDFIWYMRNLLLAATSDEALEAVDASDEQLEVLKRHASRVEPETVMRYIRILSDLSNSMRQAGNRRVLTEVAIVRLCRPQMETTDAAFRDRVRALENRLDELQTFGVPVQDTRKSTEWSGNSEPSPTPEEETAPPPHAAPEELQQIRAEWGSVKQAIGSGLLKGMLLQSEPCYNAVDMDGKLYIRSADQTLDNFIESGSRDVERFCEEIRTVIRKRYGRDVEVVLKSSREKGEKIYGISVDDILKDNNKINVPVEVSEEF
ncbi:MAG: DNA polymerase III subunit gamma/tau [Lachnospiraceae bacterium]|nr:DNA polymerase III subunit gamma/tau [Lachnospiraceae bacterium]